ncbi:RDD family protein [Paenibacillus rhizoplanae]
MTILLNLLSLRISLWAVSMVYFLSIPLFTGGRTFGKWVVRIRLRSEDGGPARPWGVWARYGLLYGVLGGMNSLMPDSSFFVSIGTALTAVAKNGHPIGRFGILHSSGTAVD